MILADVIIQVIYSGGRSPRNIKGLPALNGVESTMGDEMRFHRNLGPTPREAVAALLDLGMTISEVARYYRVSPEAVALVLADDARKIMPFNDKAAAPLPLDVGAAISNGRAALLH
ncbi:hypothetical protein [Tranquillimonas alkanivorans]|uniref:Uncharacterized protein n=1 Tax=Tranquillimonas alkanivorans TaxID=441119 RepID=A0A1I5WDQ6_9RHOB|nr:hypothetical protein [Tranquillimonas alkanivorans]SFQ17778.1 hypothetical protein SAMN04488047_14412 [Tranquillimonas alkanivorans]